MENKFLTEMFNKNIEEIVRGRIIDEINEQVNKFRERLESQKDDYIAEVMKGIRIAHSHDPMSCEMNYKIIFENVYTPKKTEATPYQPYSIMRDNEVVYRDVPICPLDPLSVVKQEEIMDESTFAIIENTEKARDEYGTCYGVNYLKISKEDIQALKEGKCLAYDDGEYSTFIIAGNEEYEEEK